MTNYIIGIDPGQTGAVCMLNMQGEVELLENFLVEDGFINFWKLCNTYNGCVIELNNSKPIPVFIEKSYAPQNQGGVEKIWRNYQTLFLAFNNPELKEITSQEWKKVLGVSQKVKQHFGNQKVKDTVKKAFSLKYQFETFCKNAKKSNGVEINWYGKTQKGNPSSVLNSGKIDAYCIALAGLHLHNIDK
jgi:hypothetical protein